VTKKLLLPFCLVLFVAGFVRTADARTRTEWTTFPEYERQHRDRNDFFREELERPGDEPVLLYTAWGASVENYLKKAGYADTEIYRIDLALFQGWGSSSPREYVDNLRKKIRTMREDHGGKVDIIAHSLGGLTARWYVEIEDGASYVDDLVTIATPHQGGYVFYAFYFTPAGRTMVPRSHLLEKLNSTPLAPSVEYTAVWSGIDEVFLFNIFGFRGAQLPEDLVEEHGNARNILGGYKEHIELAVSWKAFKKYLPYLD
jgi:pimeloyl-ACP methyl ester carboxylesterase